MKEWSLHFAPVTPEYLLQSSRNMASKIVMSTVGWDEIVMSTVGWDEIVMSTVGLGWNSHVRCRVAWNSHVHSRVGWNMFSCTFLPGHRCGSHTLGRKHGSVADRGLQTIAAGAAWSRGPRILRTASWPLAQRCALFLIIRESWRHYIAVTTVPQLFNVWFTQSFSLLSWKIVFFRFTECSLEIPALISTSFHPNI